MSDGMVDADVALIKATAEALERKTMAGPPKDGWRDDRAKAVVDRIDPHEVIVTTAKDGETNVSVRDYPYAVELTEEEVESAYTEGWFNDRDTPEKEVSAGKDVWFKRQFDPGKDNLFTTPVANPVRSRVPVSHYGTPGGVEPIDLIRSAKLDFNRGNVIKYVTRAGKKPGNATTADLRKALTYLQWAIEDAERDEE